MTFLSRANTARLLALAFVAAVNSVAASTPSIWVSDSAGHLGTVHTSTGDVHVVGQIDVGTTPIVMTDIAISPTGTMYGVAGTDASFLYRINPFTADATLIGGLGTAVNSLVFGLDGKLYAANDSLWTVNVSTGTAHDVGNNGTLYHSEGDLAFLNGKLYLTGCTTVVELCGTSHLIQIDTTNGAGTDIGDIGLNQVYGLAADDTRLFAFSADPTGGGDKFVYTINAATGNPTVMHSFTGDLIGPIFGAAAAPVPEPQAYALMLVGLAGICVVTRRRAGGANPGPRA